MRKEPERWTTRAAVDHRAKELCRLIWFFRQQVIQEDADENYHDRFVEYLRVRGFSANNDDQTWCWTICTLNGVPLWQVTGLGQKIDGR
jgi:hypothetical protein